VISDRYPAVVVHNIDDARAALATGGPVTLLSAAGAAIYGGCLWWKALTETARSDFPKVTSEDFLDCADASGQALAALRIGLCRLILWPDAPGRRRVAAIVARQGGVLLLNRPPALDLARPGAARWLHEWVRTAGCIDDNAPPRARTE
jgi:hypothetical protein